MVVYNETTLSKDECFKSILANSKKEYYSRFYLISVFIIFGLVIVILGASMNQITYVGMGATFAALALIYAMVTFYNIHRL